jgi:uncharacterized protein
MPLRVNVRLLKTQGTRFVGELAPEEATGEFHDELVRLAGPVRYDVEVERQADELRLQGRLEFLLECGCSRCLKLFPMEVRVEDLAALVPLSGDEAPALDGDIADLTPFLREDTLLALPTNPLCSPDCRGLAAQASSRDSRLPERPGSEQVPKGSPWGALDQLKL